MQTVTSLPSHPESKSIQKTKSKIGMGNVVMSPHCCRSLNQANRTCQAFFWPLWGQGRAERCRSRGAQARHYSGSCRPQKSAPWLVWPTRQGRAQERVHAGHVQRVAYTARKRAGSFLSFPLRSLTSTGKGQRGGDPPNPPLGNAPKYSLAEALR